MRASRLATGIGIATAIALVVSGCSSGTAHGIEELIAGASKIRPAEVDSVAEGFAAGIRQSDDYGDWVTDFKALAGSDEVKADMNAICGTVLDFAEDPTQDQQDAVTNLSRDLGGVTNLANRFKQDASKLNGAFNGIGVEKDPTAQQLAYDGFQKLYCKMLTAE